MDLITIFLFLILYYIIASRKIDWGVMLIIMGLPLYLWRSQLFGLPFTVLEAMILITFFVWFFTGTNFKNFLKGAYGIKDYFKNRKNRMSYPFGLEASLVIIIAFIACLFSGFSAASLGIWKAYFFEPILLFILIINNFQDKKGFRKIIFSLAIGAFAVSLYAIIQKITGLGIANEFWANPENRRAVSFFGYPNAVGLYLAPIILLITGYLYRNISSKRAGENIFLIIVILMSFLAIYFAKSEGALIASSGALVLFGLLANKTSRILAFSLIVVIGVILTVSQPLRDYTVKKATLMDLSGQIRRQQWIETWQMLEEGRFISGSGLSGYQQAIEPYHQEGIFVNDGDPNFRRKLVFGSDEYKDEHWQPVEVYLYPHNLLLNFWTELGLLGMLLFAWIFIKILFISLASFRFPFSFVQDKQISNFVRDGYCPYISLGIGCAIVTMIIHGIVDVPYFKNDLSAMFWIIMAMAGLIALKNKKIKDRKQVAVRK